MGFGGLLQILKSDKGLQIFREYAEGFLAFPRAGGAALRFRPQAASATSCTAGGIPWSTPSLSPALIGIGYIIGPELASINVCGRRHRVVGADPAAAVLRSRPAARGWAPAPTRPDVVVYTVWYNIVRPIAVGTMLVGACYTLFSMRALHLPLAARRFRRLRRRARERSDRSARSATFPSRGSLSGVIVLLVPITAIYYYFTQGAGWRRSSRRSS